ncbi:hypothetical protein SmJEL517_g05334 [Synchytrium microbalum]|uniref:Glucose-methanol-choline oxidoreductase N-terminal domain-containing protein n=1 Tax=Synchytrium microbalum TaxID=1806994 RepID=A0A507BZT9_9FUNG|nr:uncharacterized protein SmJEL517_g05334 [Synchytrium microbalum]TPX31314.1 hypothetical protein SmJEL517_g05334 [Synchytrium microbalum]
MLTSRKSLSDVRPDIIITGGGTAGCIVASRLSEGLPHLQILLVEAGPDSKGIAIINELARFREAKNYWDWGFKTTPQKHLRNHRVAIERGKVLGGSSCINWLAVVRGHRQDWDEIQQETGITGWGYKDMLPCYKRFENYVMQPDLSDAEFRSKGGPIPVVSFPVEGYGAQFIKAGNDIGFGLGLNGRIDAACKKPHRMNHDYNGKSQGGIGPMQVAVNPDLSRGCNTAAQYIHPYIDPKLPKFRANLHVLTESLVTKIVFDSNAKSTGIECLVDGKTTLIQAVREVIVCQGALQSPQLLMLSGVGPRAHLEENGIKCVFDNPQVGQNLGDHLLVHVAFKCKTEPSGGPTGPIAFWSTEKYLKRCASRGIKRPATNMESYPIKVALPFLLKDRQKETIDVKPLGPLKPGQTFDATAHKQKGFITNVPTDFGPHLHFQIVLNKMQSRGWIKLAGANPLLAPLINPNYYEVRDDLVDMVEGIRGIRTIVQQMKQYMPDLGDEIADEAILEETERVTSTNRDDALASDMYLEEFVRRQSGTVWHVCGTCLLGSVVDERCRVKGVQGVRVVDASIINAPAGNTMASVCAVAERAAELILEEYRGARL